MDKATISIKKMLEVADKMSIPRVRDHGAAGMILKNGESYDWGESFLNENINMVAGYHLIRTKGEVFALVGECLRNKLPRKVEIIVDAGRDLSLSEVIEVVTQVEKNCFYYDYGESPDAYTSSDLKIVEKNSSRILEISRFECK